MIYEVEPILNYRIWGGNKLKEYFNKQEIQKPIGEVFLVSSMPNAECRINGMDFNDFYNKYPEYFDLSYARFPLRINLIDAQDDLSIQLHPRKAEIGNKHLANGIEEAWYIVDSQVNSELVLGIKTKDHNKAEELIRKNQCAKLLNRQKANSGTFVFLPAGVVHAISKGCLVYEVTYNIDITYRLFDYDRVDSITQKPRSLHIEEGLADLNLANDCRCVESGEDNITGLIDQDEGFKIEKIICRDRLEIEQDSFYFYTIIKGEGMIEDKQAKNFATYFVDRKQKTVSLKGNMELIRVTFKEKK